MYMYMMYMYIYMYMYIMHIYMYMYMMYIYIYTYMYMYIMYIYICMYMYIIVYQFSLHLPSSIHISIPSYLYRVLSSNEVLSTDEESSDTGGESEDELSRNLESLLSSKKTALDLTHEQEEAERQELRRLLMEDQPVSVSLSLSLSLCLSLSLSLSLFLSLPLSLSLSIYFLFSFRSVVKVAVILMNNLIEVCTS